MQRQAGHVSLAIDRERDRAAVGFDPEGRGGLGEEVRIGLAGVDDAEFIAGALDPDCIHLPGVYVQRMVIGAPYEKKIEFTTTREWEIA